MDDTATKIRYARANDELDTGKDTQRVLSLLSRDDWVARHKINRALKTSREGCQGLIDAMVAAGLIVVEMRKTGQRPSEFLKLV